MKFCGNCGTPQNAACPNCQFENPPGFKFCGSCGQALSANTAKTAAAAEAPPAASRDKVSLEGQRRHLTVMFCDLVGSTALSNRLDPEDLRELVRQYQGVCEKVIARYEGHVAQFLGDGILVYFGHPIAHEDDAHRAVSSGLGIIEAIQAYNDHLEEAFGTRISVRIGIHTGHVVIGSMGGDGQSQQLALGVTPNIAARLEGLAESNTLIISENTHNLIKRYFNSEDKGQHAVKGISEPIQVYRVIHENMARTRLEVQGDTVEMTPLVGRDNEIDRLYDLWEEAKAGRSNVVLLSGEPGLGKSRIIQSIVQHTAKEEDAWLVFHHCSPYHKQTAFYPIAQLISQIALQFKPDEPDADKIKRLEGFLLQFGMLLDEMLPLFAGIMSLSLVGSVYRPTPFSPEQQKQKLIGALLKMYIDKSQDQTIMVVYEDLQWMDDLTLELVTQLINQCSALKALIVLSFRTEFAPPWRMQGHIVPMPLSNLPHDAVGQIISKLAKGKSVPDEVVEQIVQKTDGIPLFVEELTKMVLGSEILIEQDDSYVLNGPISALAIPSTLHDSLEARLDRMSHTKQIAQMGAAIGREFSYDLIRVTSMMDEEATHECLNQLVEAELLIQRGFPPNCKYKFRHALIQDAAYQSLLKTQRRQFHERIALAITQDLPEYAEQKPEVVAHHYERALQPRKSVRYWADAGSKVKKHLAYDESLNYIARGMKHLDKIEDTQERASCELSLLMIQAPVFFMTQGFQSQKGYEASLRMKELASQLGDDMGMFKALRGLITHEIFAGHSKNALKYARNALVIAESLGPLDLQMEAYRLIGQASIYTGDLVQALQALDRSIELYESIGVDSTSRLIGADPGVFSLIQSSHVCWYLGYPDQALERARRAAARADEIEQPFSQALSKFILIMVLGYVGDYKNMLHTARDCVEISKEFGIIMFVMEAESMLGFAEIQSGDVEKGFERTRQAIIWRLDHGLIGGLNLHAAYLCQAYLDTGKYEQGLNALNEALSYVDKSEDQLLLSELYRLNAELLHAIDSDLHKNAIVKSLEESLSIAQNQEAVALEIRTNMSMVRIGKKYGDAHKELALLQQTYNEFTQGFDTKDLKEAKALLEGNN